MPSHIFLQSPRSKTIPAMLVPFPSAGVGSPVVDIISLSVNKVSKKPLPHHIKDHRRHPVMARSAAHITMLAGTLGGVNDLPTFFKTVPQRQFGVHMFIVLHRKDRYGCV